MASASPVPSKRPQTSILVWRCLEYVSLATGYPHILKTQEMNVADEPIRLTQLVEAAG